MESSFIHLALDKGQGGNYLLSWLKKCFWWNSLFADELNERSLAGPGKLD